MKLKELKTKQIFKMAFRGKVRLAELIAINGTRAEVLFKGDKKPLNLSVESEVLGVVGEAKITTQEPVVAKNATTEKSSEVVEVAKQTETKPKTTRKKTEAKG